tara:strand:+ start:241 stop:618 length:378 start_codon:yes stop_codon:yes gene_type:complete
MLDATAGNRSQWGYTKRGNQGVVFIDRDTRLWNPPHIFADFRFLPFRNDVFDVVLFDPPYYIRGNTPSSDKWFFWNPDGKKKEKIRAPLPSLWKIYVPGPAHQKYFRREPGVLSSSSASMFPVGR